MSSDLLLLSPVDSSTGQQSKLPFLPAVPPKMPKELLSYTIAFQDAPLTALRGVVVDGRQPPRLQVSPRSRVRSQVGCTNRWRLPESLGGDLLGTAQALKSLNEHYSQSIMAVMTADNPATSLNVNTQDHLNQQDLHRRPCTSPRKESKHKDPPDVNKRHLTTAPGRLSVGSCHPIKKYQPTSARSPTPLDIFHYHSYPVKNLLGPDILLECLNSNWELHRPYIQKSGTLTTLLQQASQEPKKELYYRDPMCATLDQYINKSQYYSNEYQEMSRRLSMTDSTPQNKQKRDKDHPGHTTPARRSIVTKLKLKVTDVFVTKEALAVALGNLYHDKLEVNNCSIVSVLACASMLQFEDLIKRCEHLMLGSIHSETVCSYHYAGVKYKVGSVTACERWLELNLIPSLSVQIHLRELPLILLQRLLKSSRLFVYNEYYVYKLLCYWIFLQHHPHIMLMPSHSTIVTYFNSLPKNCSFIEREDGQAYAGLFLSLRMHGITDTRNLDDMVRMNVVPQPWVLKMLSQHYQALQGGGDMSLMLNFNNDAIRAGFIIEQEPRYHTEVISLYGFHFELKAHRLGKEHTYQFYMQRLKPHDPTLSFKACERQTFSMRQDREVRYSIRTQSKIDGNDYMFNTGILSKKFGLGSKTSRSEILTLEGLSLPIYVTFSLLFPPS